MPTNNQESPPLLPTDLLPSALGLSWGLSAAECVHLLPATPTTEDKSFIRVPLAFGDSTFDVELFIVDPDDPGVHHWYDMRGNRHDWARAIVWDNDDKVIMGSEDDPVRPGLFHIQTELYFSRVSFFEIENTQGSEIMREVRNRVFLEYENKYHDLIAYFSGIIGPPAFSGPKLNTEESNSNENFPDKFTNNPLFPIEQWASILAYWIHPEGILQLAMPPGETEWAGPSITVSCHRS